MLQAAANAKNNNGAQKSKLVVAECFADQGPILKRFRCRAQGRWGHGCSMLHMILADTHGMLASCYSAIMQPEATLACGWVVGCGA
jgi:hypothetical protein